MDQEQKSAGSMKNESLKERVSNTTDNSLSECEGGNALMFQENRQSNNLIALRKFCLHYLQVLALRKITKDRSIGEYSAPVWQIGNCSPLEKIQRKGLALSSGVPGTAGLDTLDAEAGVKPLEF